MCTLFARFFCLFVLAVPGTALAFVVVPTDQSQPYEVVPVEAVPGAERLFLGTLEGYPIMYELIAEEPFTFTAEIAQAANRVQQPLTLLLVRQNDRGGGVREIARMTVLPESWTRQRDSQLGLSFTTSPRIEEDVSAGIYRIEVSTPENTGDFMLRLGNAPESVGYLDQLAAVRQVQQWFGYGVLSMLLSSLVYYPLGIMVLLYLIYKTWQFRAYLRPRTIHESHS